MLTIGLLGSGGPRTPHAAGGCHAWGRARQRWACLLACAVLLAPLRVGAASRAGVEDRAGVRRQVEHVVGGGDTFGALLARAGVPADEVGRWLRAARAHADLRRLMPGRVLSLAFDARGRLAALRYDLTSAHRVAVTRDEVGRLHARREAQPVRVRAVGARGVVDRSFQDAAMRAGIPDAVTSQLVDLLSWRLDFKADLHRGDRFHVLWEQRTSLAGHVLAPGRVLAVEYVGRRDSAAAYWLASDGGDDGAYVDDRGRLLDGAPLRFPLEFTRISSAFSDARLHPILHRNRPHHGVDFAAPAGTPVRAIGPAVVRFAGVKHGYGNYIELDHGEEMVSAYAHLQGFARGVRTGARLARGALLGWVGQTGLATGPHLHFAIFVRDAYVDPLTIRYPAQARVVDAAAFGPVRARLQAQLRAIPQGSPLTASAAEREPSPLALGGRSGPITLTL